MRYNTQEIARDSLPGEMMRTIGIIGVGSIGQRHGRNLTAMGYQVVGFDPINIGDGYPTIWPIPQNGLDRMDAVLICSPTDQHVNDLIAIADHVPVFMEKPIGATQTDYEFLKNSSIDLNQIKMVGYNLRFHGCVKKAKEWLDAEMIGKPLWANFTLGQFSEKLPYLRNGVILNWSHEIDLAVYLLGDATVMASTTALMDGKDYMTDILLKHKEDSCRSTVHLDYVSDPEHRRFRIHGSDGIIEVDLVRFTADLYCETPTEPFRWKDATWNNTYTEEMQAFLDRIDGKYSIGCTGLEALKVLEICLKVRDQAGL